MCAWQLVSKLNRCSFDKKKINIFPLKRVWKENITLSNVWLDGMGCQNISRIMFISKCYRFDSEMEVKFSLNRNLNMNART